VDFAVLDALAAFMPRLTTIVGNYINDPIDFIPGIDSQDLDDLHKWKFISSLKFLKKLVLHRYCSPEFKFPMRHIEELFISTQKLINEMDLLTITLAKDTLKSLTIESGSSDTYANNLVCYPIQDLKNLEKLSVFLGPEDNLNDLIGSWTLPKLLTFEISCEIDEEFVDDPSSYFDIPILLFQADSTIIIIGYFGLG